MTMTHSRTTSLKAMFSNFDDIAMFVYSISCVCLLILPLAAVLFSSPSSDHGWALDILLTCRLFLLCHHHRRCFVNSIPCRPWP